MASASAFDRHKDFDIVLLTCTDSGCYAAPVEDLRQPIKQHKWNTYPHHVHPNANYNEVQSYTSKAVISLVLVCRHNEKQIAGYFDKMSQDSIVILCSKETVKSKVLKKAKPFNLKSSSKFDTLIKTIEDSMIVQANYDDFHTQEHEADDSMDDIYESVDLNDDHIYTHQESQLSIPPSPPASRPFSTKTVPFTRTDVKGYVDVETFTTDDISGVLALQSYILPGSMRGLAGCSVEELVERMNFEDASKHHIACYLMSHTVKELTDKKLIHELTTLLKCQNSAIQNKTFESLEKILYTKDIRLWSIPYIAGTIKNLTSTIKVKYIHQEQLQKLIHLLSMFLSILLLLTRIRHDGEITTKQTASIVLRFLEGISTTKLDNISQRLVLNLKTMITSVPTSVSNSGGVPIENWRDSLQRQNVKKNLLEFFHKFTPMEMFANVFAVINQVLQSNQSGNVPLIQFLRKLMKRTFEILERKDTTLLSTIVGMVSNGVVKLFLEHENDLRSTLFGQSMVDLFNYILAELKKNSTASKLTLGEIEPLLLFKDKDVVESVITFLRKNEHNAHSVVMKTIYQIDRKLQNLDIHIHEDMSETLKQSPVPVWHNISGRLGHCDVQINLHILLPSLHCLMQGKTHKCQCNAVEKSTKFHENNLNILHCLNNEDTAPIHVHVTKMIAYQWKYMPRFYITERFHIDSLSGYLLQKRMSENWLSQDCLLRYCMDAIEAVMYVHSKHIFHRDLTAKSFSISSSGKIVLSKFDVAVQWDESKDSITDLEARIPLRWSAPESILRDEFNMATDTWMVGQLLYEILTHGCHPYTELYNQTLGDILELIFFRDLKPRPWPCIPPAVHSVILSFVKTSPDGRASLDNGKEKLETYMKSLPSEKRSSLKDTEPEIWVYPQLDKSQQEVTETDLPEYIKNFKESGPDPTSTYYNLEFSRRRTAADLQISEGDLISKDDPIIGTRGPILDIKEPATKRFLQNSFPAMKRNDLELKEILNLKTWPLEVDRSGGNITLCYECNRGDNVKDIARRKMYGLPSKEHGVAKYLQIVSAMADFVKKVHTRRWVLRDMCCTTLYCSKSSFQVFSSRIGRMVKLSEAKNVNNCFTDEILEDRRNWLPLETLQQGIYSRESDMYMLAMTIYEFFATLDLKDPVDNDLKRVPFCRVIKEELCRHLLNNERPRQPDSCPDWLYNLLVKCWNRDSTERMTAKELAENIKKRLYQPPHQGMEHTYEDPSEESQLSRRSSFSYENSTTDNQSSFSYENSTTDIQSDYSIHYENCSSTETEENRVEFVINI